MEIPFQVDSHFKKFAIKYRARESVEDVKLVLAKLEKESLLLNLIPIAFNEELDREVQLNELFVNTKDSINIIWDFILISSRFYDEPEGLFACYSEEFKRLDKYFIEHSTLPLAESEVIVDIFKYYININENLLGQRYIEIGTDAIDTSRGGGCYHEGNISADSNRSHREYILKRPYTIDSRSTNDFLEA